MGTGSDPPGFWYGASWTRIGLNGWVQTSCDQRHEIVQQVCGWGVPLGRCGELRSLNKASGSPGDFNFKTGWNEKLATLPLEIKLHTCKSMSG